MSTAVGPDDPVATLIGDVVGSREVTDRRGLHRLLVGALEEANEDWEPLAPLRVTVGDEYQGVFRTVGSAIGASQSIRLALLPDVDVRHGLGWGGVGVLDEEPRVEDGPGWWAARDAIEQVKQAADRAATAVTRTGYRRAEGVPGPDEEALGAALALHDLVLGSVPERSLSVLRGLLAGRTQREIAEEAGVSPSAVSQRVRHDGLAMVVGARRRLHEVR